MGGGGSSMGGAMWRKEGGGPGSVMPRGGGRRLGAWWGLALAGAQGQQGRAAVVQCMRGQGNGVACVGCA
jgi:hypothetical protein